VQDPDVLLTIAELAVAFAGFASVVVLFQHRDPGRWPADVGIRLRTMIEGSLVTLFSALLPFVLHHLGLVGPPLWTTASLALAFAYPAFGIRVWRRSRGAIASGHLSGSFSSVIGAVTVCVTVALLCNAAGIGFAGDFGPYLLGVAWSLVFASLMFLRLAAFPIAGAESESGPSGSHEEG
jgi:hypothetical protein